MQALVRELSLVSNAQTMSDPILPYPNPSWVLLYSVQPAQPYAATPDTEVNMEESSILQRLIN